MIDVAIIASVLAIRKPLLERSIVTWRNSIISSGLDCKICINSQGWDASYLKDKDTEVYYSEPTGSHVHGYNYFAEKENPSIFLFSHPDLLFPLDTVRTAYEEASKGNTFAAFKIFWLPQEMTEHLEEYDWRHPETLEQQVELFPKFDDGHGVQYWNGDVREKTEWHSTTTFAVDSEVAHFLYPMPDLRIQGYDDPLHYMIRSNSGIEDVCIMNPVLMHQHHPQSWNGDSKLAVEQAREAFHKYYAPRLKEWKSR